MTGEIRRCPSGGGRALEPSLATQSCPDDPELVAEGDAVFAWFNHVVTFHDGSTTTHRALAYYGLADGKIAVNDVMFDPDLMKVMGAMMAPPPGAPS
jgi:hypothetical protein